MLTRLVPLACGLLILALLVSAAQSAVTNMGGLHP